MNPQNLAAPAAATPATSPGHLRRVVTASMLGTAVEWYDFFVYGAAAALVFGPQFFPAFSPVAGTLAAFSTFAIGFVGRPLGGAILGHYGDRIGRKSVLVLSLLVMGIATFAIGLLPTYAAIGVWAPVLLVLLRFLQGMAVGGEWAGAVLMAVEHAPHGRRGFYGSFPQMGVPLGLILSNGVFLALAATLSADEFAAWGWRVPFLLSAVLVAVGLFIRLRVAESPYFQQVKVAGRERRMPVLDVFREHKRYVFLAGGSFIATNTIGYIFIAYVLSYATTVLGMEKSMVLWLLIVASGVWLAGIGPFAQLSDRLGRRRVFLSGVTLMAASSLVFFPLINTTSPLTMLLALVMVALGLAAAYGPQAALFAELFPTEVRTSGASLGYQIGAVLGGGLAPLVATALYQAAGSTVLVAAYMVGVCVISIVAILAVPETVDTDLAR
jgi:metabolite-proton symporter